MSGPADRADDAGFTLLEVLAALVVFAIFMAGLGAGTMTVSKALLRTRVRMGAVTLAQQYVEKARSRGFGGIGSLPTPDSVTANGVTYQVQQTVTTPKSFPGSSGFVYSEKQLSVTVSWVYPGASQPSSYSLETLVDNAQPPPPGVMTGLVIFVDDAATGQPIGADGNDEVDFDVKITGSTTISDTTEEGEYQNQTIPSGLYTCTVSRNDTSANWSSGGQSSVTQSCNVISGQLTTVTTTWAEATACASVASKGSLSVLVTDGTSPIANAPVQLQNATTGQLPPKVNTNASGVALFNNNLTGDQYYYSVSGLPGYQNSGMLGPVCVYAGSTATAQVTARPNPTGSVMTIQVAITNKDPSKAYQIAAEDPLGDPPWSQTLYVASTKTATATFDSMPVGRPYAVTVCVDDLGSTNCNQLASWSSLDYSKAGSVYKLVYTDQPGGV